MIQSAAIMIVTALVLAGEPARAVLDTVMTDSIFEAVCRLLRLSEAQRERAAEVQVAYLKSATALDEKAHQEMLDSGWREIERLEAEWRLGFLERHSWTQEKRQQAEREHFEQTAALMGPPTRVAALARREGDKLLGQALEQLAAVLDEQQLALYDRLPRLIRRLSHFGAFEGSGRRDFQTPINLFLMLDTAGAESEQLEFLAQVPDPWVDAVDGVPPECLDEIRMIVAAYEVRFDDLLQARFARLRELPGEDTKWILEHDDPDDRKAIEREFRTSASSFRALTDSIVQISEGLTKHFGPEPASSWMRFFHKRLCPDLVAPRWNDGMLAWLDAHAPDPDQRAAVALVQQSYAQSMQAAIDQAIAAALLAKREYASVDGSNREQQIAQQRLAKVTTVEHDAFRSFFQLLSKDQQDALRTELTPERVGWLLAAP